MQSITANRLNLENNHGAKLMLENISCQMGLIGQDVQTLQNRHEFCLLGKKNSYYRKDCYGNRWKT